ncbi:hypothetical protein [Chamaesiphon sp. VAR_69_metabat_338]|uniref:hypothetical protein n=1 Tax=Chamaesiphon sp. VAR_69_metabat_338 TaxID=2964704 RepID=UPI00286DE937|nr:hypothetical protein [Chamaesiphon sp. VAR_69_metabat_338]
MSSAQFPPNRPPSQPEAATRPAKPIKRPKKPDPADYPPLPPMFQLTGNTPIPPASEPLQYRAIGLILGKYIPSSEEFNQGMLLADDGTEIDAVILGRIMSLIKNHLDLEKSHLWVVYPRIRKEDNKLHAQIMGMWDPQLTIEPVDPTDPEPPNAADPAPIIPTLETLGIPDSYFSIRGEVIYQSRETKEIFVKIRQAPKKKTDEERYFKIRLVGDLPQKLVGNFWDFDAIRVDNDLQIHSGQFVATVRAKSPRKGGGKPPDGSGGSSKPFKKSWDASEARESAPRSDVDRPKPAPVKRSLPPKLDLPDPS